jgi:hypothetical protein
LFSSFIEKAGGVDKFLVGPSAGGAGKWTEHMVSDRINNWKRLSMVLRLSFFSIVHVVLSSYLTLLFAFV